MMICCRLSNLLHLISYTLAISLLELAISFPATILFALLLNEIKSKRFKKAVQTVSYMPHFISMVVVAGLIMDFCNSRGVIASIVAMFNGGKAQNLLGSPEYWRPVYIISGLWKELGFGSIIYLAALSGVDQQLYEAAEIDGASRFQQTIHVTLPGIAPTIIIMVSDKITSNDTYSMSQAQALYLMTPSRFGGLYAWTRELASVPEKDIKAFDIWGVADDSYIIPARISYTSEESAERAKIVAEVTTYMEENSVKFITGVLDIDAEWDNYVQELKNMGVERAIEITQAALERFNAR